MLGLTNMNRQKQLIDTYPIVVVASISHHESPPPPSSPPLSPPLLFLFCSISRNADSSRSVKESRNDGNRFHDV
jgi:hypothetical protein